LPLGQGIVREIDEQFIGREIDALKVMMCVTGLLENLRPPACFAPA